MRLLTFSERGQTRIGVLVDDGNAIVDLTAAGLPATMNGLIDEGSSGLERAHDVISAQANRINISETQILAPIPRPKRNIICVGKNYYDHAAEFHKSGFDSTGKQALPEFPVVFTKAPTSVTGPGMAITLASDYSNSTDYEGELGVVLATGGRNISKSGAYSYVFGYTVINDVTARTIQRQHDQWFLGKSPDSYCPMGPVLVTADEIGDVETLRLQTIVNGEVRQDALVRDLIFDIPTLLETFSRTMTLEPADIIATGTPAGVGIGSNPPVYLKQGDRVLVDIDRIGTLENVVS